MRLFLLRLVAFFSLALTLPTFAQVQAPSGPEPFQALASRIEEAINNGRFDDLTSLFAQNFSVTMSDQTVLSPGQSIADFREKWFGGKKPFIRNVQFKIIPNAAPLVNDGKIAVLRGTGFEQYRLDKGKNLSFNTRWTTTLINENGEWKILHIHNGVDFTDNAYLSAARNYTNFIAVAALVVGLILGIALAKLFGRRKSA